MTRIVYGIIGGSWMLVSLSSERPGLALVVWMFAGVLAELSEYKP